MKKYISLFIILIFETITNCYAQLTINSNNDAVLPFGKSYWIGSSTNSGNRMRLNHDGLYAYIDYEPELIFRKNTMEVFRMNGNIFKFSQASSRIAIGTTDNPIATLHVNGETYLPSGKSYWIASKSDEGIRLRLHCTTSGAQGAYIDFYPKLQFRSGATSSMEFYPLTLTNSYVGINKTTPTCALDINGVAKVNGAIVLTSDIKVKEDIKELKNTLNSLQSLQAFTYKLKKMAISRSSKVQMHTSINSDSTNNITSDTIGKNTPPVFGDSVIFNRQHIGFIAQSVKEVYPELVYEDETGTLSIDYISLIPILVEAIKELNYKISIIEQTNKNIRKENEQLKAKIQTINEQLTK